MVAEPLYFEGVSSFSSSLRGGVVVPGNFDGWHLGHSRLCEWARRETGLEVIVLTFEPHPRDFFSPQSPPFRLTSAAQKLLAMGESGAVCAIVSLAFDADLAAMEAESFIRDILLDGLGAAHVAVGYDFCFGRDRKGTVADLQAHIATTPIAAQTDSHGEIISSSRLRTLIAEGKVDEAQHYLGRPYRIAGIVQRGDSLGKTLGFPTANIGLSRQLRPRRGVYACSVRIAGDNSLYGGVTNYGVRPTIDGTSERFETHIFNFTDDIYGREVEVSLLSLLRAEMKFASKEALQEQMARDCAAANAYLARL